MTDTVAAGRAGADVFPGPSEMAARCRALDWAATALGAPDGWPPALRTLVRTCLESPFPVNLWCGPELVLVYNDAYRRALGEKHPAALGRPGLEVWAEIRDAVEPMFARIRDGGPPVFAEDARFVMARGGDGPGEAAWFTFGLSPVRDEAGGIVAYFNPATETTARVAAERDLAESNRALALERSRLSAVFAQSPSFLAVLRGPDNVFEFVNAAYAQLVARPPEALVGRALFDAIPEARGQGFDALLGRVRETGEPLVFRDLPARLARADGAPLEERFLDITYLPLVEPDGARDAVIAHGTDVTDQVRARAELQAANAQLQEQQVELELTNQQLQEQQAELELSSQHLEEQGVELAGQAEALRAANARLEAALADAVRARAEADAARGEAERARRATDRVLAATDDGLLGTDLSGLTTFVNPAAERLLGYAAAELIGRPQHAMIHHSRADGSPYPVAECPLAQGRHGDRTARVDGEVFWRKDGTPVPVEYAMTPVVEDGAVVGTLVTFRDVRARRAADAERARLLAVAEAARDEAEGARERADAERARADAERERAAAANRAKSAFLATMSHELRTPLNAIAGYTQLLELGLAGPTTAQQRDYLTRLAASGQHLLGLVNDVLDLAKVDAGELTVAREPATTETAVAAALDLVRPQADARGVRLVDANPDVTTPYVGDEHRVRQVLVNLLSNAVKFTEPGGTVTVACGTAESAPAAAALHGEGPWAFVRVADTGIGIAPDQHAAVFEPFHQVEQGHTRTKGGTGLGLAISRRLARLMGGDLTLESTPGVGSTFTLWLPAARLGEHRPGDADETPAARAARAVRAGPAVVRGLAELGGLLRRQLDAVVHAYVDLLRGEPRDAPGIGRAMRPGELEDHMPAFLADLSQSLVLVGEAGRADPGMLADSTAINRTIAERHGARRFAQGWDRAALARDYAALREVLARTVRADAAAAGADAEAALGILLGFVDLSEARAVAAWQAAHAAASEDARTR